MLPASTSRPPAIGVAPDVPLTPLQLARRTADEAAAGAVGRENM